MVSLLRSRWLLCGALWLVLGCGRAPERYRTFSDADAQPAEAPADAAQSPARQNGEGGASTAAATPAPPSSVPPMVEPTASPDPGAATPPLPDSPPIPPRGADVTSPPPVAGETPGPARPPRVPEPIRIAMISSNGAGGNGSLALAAVGGGTPSPAVPREPQLLVPEKEFQRVPPGGALRVSYDDLDLLKVLNMDPVPVDCVDYFPDWLKSLDGARIRIRGFMIPPLRETGLPAFTLARDNQICCFGRDPKVYDVIPVQLKEGTTTDYIPNRPFDVVGRFVIRPQAFRGQLENLYEIEDAEIIAR